jgi:chromosome segregation ATPase
MPKPDPILIEKINKLNEEISDFETRIKAKDIELNARRDKISELNSELNDLKKQKEVNLKEIDGLNSKIALLEQELGKSTKELEILTENHSKLIDQLDGLSKSYDSLSKSYNTYETAFSSTKEMLHNKETQNLEFQEKIKNLNQRVFDLSQEKDKILKEKLSLTENYMNEKMEMSNEIIGMKHTIENYEDNVKSLKKKVKSSGEGLLGHSMEIEILKKKIDEKDAELEKIEGFLKGETGIFGEINSLIQYVKEQFKEIRRSIRIVLPDFSYLAEYELASLITELDNKIIVNIAIPFPEDYDIEMINALKERDVVITDTPEKNIFALLVDGATLALGVLSSSGEDVRGIFTTTPELINLLNAALMYPFVKGKKL